MQTVLCNLALLCFCPIEIIPVLYHVAAIRRAVMRSICITSATSSSTRRFQTTILPFGAFWSCCAGRSCDFAISPWFDAIAARIDFVSVCGPFFSLRCRCRCSCCCRCRCRCRCSCSYCYCSCCLLHLCSLFKSSQFTTTPLHSVCLNSGIPLFAPPTLSLLGKLLFTMETSEPKEKRLKV